MAIIVIIDFLKFDFVKINLKKHNLAKLHNFSSPKLKIKGRWGRRAPALGDFWKNILHFRHISAKIQLKNLKQHFDWEGGLGPLATPLHRRPHGKFKTWLVITFIY